MCIRDSSYSSLRTPKAIVQWRRLLRFRAKRTSYSRPESVVNKYTLPETIAGGIYEYDFAVVGIATQV